METQCATSSSSLVNKSAMLIFPFMCSSQTIPDWTASLTGLNNFINLWKLWSMKWIKSPSNVKGKGLYFVSIVEIE